ncbi:hypothetical protein M527_11765 [Sphingobium indicum IP26]|nr:hypothetical protein M527_11765 [Sphingobium indicum IP26]EQB05697.1 hypothetical protein L286_07775 [Sphingobium sp. HDIP04]
MWSGAAEGHEGTIIAAEAALGAKQSDSEKLVALVGNGAGAMLVA